MIDAWIAENSADAQVALFFTLFAVFALVELFAAVRSPGSKRRRWTANLALTGLNIVVLSLLPVSFFTAAVWSRAHGLGLLNVVQVPLELAAAGTLLGRGFVSFFSHYLLHKVPILWRVHRVHHLDTEMDVSTTVRFHPVEFAVNLVIGVPLVAALGLTPWVLLVYELLDVVVTLFSHANISLPPQLERVVRYLIVTPDLHRVHHSSSQPETDSNFGAVFPIWDIVLGTFRTAAPTRQVTMQLGIEEVRDRRTHSVWWLLASPRFGELDQVESEASAEARRGRGAVGREVA